MAKNAYKIVWDDIVEHMLRNFEGDFEEAMRDRLPTLEEAERIPPLGRDPWRFDVEVDADDRTWDVVSYLEKEANRLVVLGAYPKSVPPEQKLRSRDEAFAFIDAELKKGPRESMTGAEYVHYIWGKATDE